MFLDYTQRAATMSWIPFRKQPKKPTSELVTDNEFDTQVEKFNKTEANTRKMYKDMKRYVEQNSGLIKTHQKFGQDLATNGVGTVKEDEPLNEALEDMQQVLQKQCDLQIDLNSNLRKLFIDPMKKFNVHFNTVNSAIKRREQSLQDYAKYLNRREKYKENPSQSGKFDANERYLALAKADFERRNAKLMETIPKFYEYQLTYFEPCFEGVIKSHYMDLKDSRDLFEGLAVKLDCPTEQWSDEQYKEETKNRLAEIKALSIVK